MRALEVQSFNGPEGLRVVECNAPTPGDDELLIEVAAAGVSFADLLQAQGLYQVRPTPPFRPGMEGAGTVLEAPAGAPLTAGDRVCFSSFGAFAEVVSVAMGAALPLPDVLTFPQGAGLIVNYQTALFALSHRAALRAGETVLVLGAAGGVGTSAIQVAKGLSAGQIIGVTSTEEKAAVARDAGADHVVLLADGWKDQVRTLTGGAGVDLVYDPVGAELFLDGLRSLAPNGRLVVIGFAGGAIPEVRVNRLLLRNVSLIGAAWGEAVARDATLPHRIHDQLLPLIERGAVAPPVGAEIPLARAADAYRLLADRRAIGKIVLTMR